MWRAVQSFVGSLSVLARKTGGAEAAMPERPASSAPPPIRILSLLAGNEDRALMGRVSRSNAWDLSEADFGDAVAEAQRLRPPVILLDRDVAGTAWNQSVSSLVAASGGACVLLVSRAVDDRLCNEVMSRGGYDVLRKPLREEDLRRAVKLAGMFWNGLRRNSALTRAAGG